MFHPFKVTVYPLAVYPVHLWNLVLLCWLLWKTSKMLTLLCFQLLAQIHQTWLELRFFFSSPRLCLHYLLHCLRWQRLICLSMHLSEGKYSRGSHTNSYCSQDSSMALESSHGTSRTYSVSPLAWGGNLYVSGLWRISRICSFKDGTRLSQSESFRAEGRSCRQE